MGGVCVLVCVSGKGGWAGGVVVADIDVSLSAAPEEMQTFLVLTTVPSA